MGSRNLAVQAGTTYADMGATATDAVDKTVDAKVRVTGLPVNTSVVGEVRLRYDVTDASGNAAATITRVVVVQVRLGRE